MNAMASVRDESVRDEFVERACDMLAETMAPEHKVLVENELRAHAAWELTPGPDLESPGLEPAPEPKLGNLTQVFLHLINFAAMGDPRPIALPPKIAAIYIDEPAAWPLAECRSCGYRMPARLTGESLRYMGTFQSHCAFCGSEM